MDNILDDLNAAFEILMLQAENDAGGDTSKAFNRVIEKLRHEASEYEVYPAEECGPIFDYGTEYADNNCGEYDQHYFFTAATQPLPETWGVHTVMYHDTDRQEIRHFSYREATIQ